LKLICRLIEITIGIIEQVKGYAPDEGVHEVALDIVHRLRKKGYSLTEINQLAMIDALELPIKRASTKKH
jgi:hypothetical protein